MTLNYSSIFSRRVENVQDASPKYATIFQCYFEHDMTNLNASKMTFMKPIQVRDASNFTVKYSGIFRRSVISTSDASTQLSDASKMQLRPQWLTIDMVAYS